MPVGDVSVYFRRHCIDVSANHIRIMITLIQRQDSSPMDGLDHLFLLPERALTMDATRLQKDLAGLDFDVRLLHEAPMGNIWLCKCGFNRSKWLFKRTLTQQIRLWENRWFIVFDIKLFLET